MHDIPRKDREDADDVDEDEVSDVSGGSTYTDPDGGCIPVVPDYPRFPGITDPFEPVIQDPYAE